MLQKNLLSMVQKDFIQKFELIRNWTNLIDFSRRSQSWTSSHNLNISEAIARRCPVKKVFLEISPNSQESACARISF